MNSREVFGLYLITPGVAAFMTSCIEQDQVSNGTNSQCMCDSDQLQISVAINEHPAGDQPMRIDVLTLSMPGAQVVLKMLQKPSA